ncbi:MAG: transposase family protein [Bacteroidetes bacterium]|nr:transposase family protein [Bacteroidota bacterium]
MNDKEEYIDFVVYFSFYCNRTAMPRIKKSYSTEFIRCYKTGLLNKEEVKSVPRSTRYYWRSKNLNTHVVPKYFEDKAHTILYLKYEKLLQLTKGLLIVVHCYKTIFSTTVYRKVFISNHKIKLLSCILTIQNKVGLKRCLHWLSISYQQYYAWVHQYDCTASLLKLCRKRYKHQLSEKEVLTIKRYLDNERFAYWSLSSIYCQMLVDKAAFISIGVFRKYAKLLCFVKQKISNNKCYTSLKATAPFKTLHLDVTIFKTLDNGKCYLYFLMDNFSRNILNYRVANTCNAAISKELLQECFSKHACFFDKGCMVVTDDGMEYKGCFTEFVNNETCITHIIAQHDIVQSNSMIEAANKRMKYEFLFTKTLENFEAVAAYLPKAVDNYNNKPLLHLSGYSPTEVLNGCVPDGKRFSDSIATAVANRKNSNTDFNCCLAYH